MISKCFYNYNSFLRKLPNANNIKLYFLCNNQYCTVLPESSEIGNDIPESPDPVIKKYRKMLDDLADKQKTELLYETNFGSVRFDSDKVTQKNHTNFMKEGVLGLNLQANDLKHDNDNDSNSSMNYFDEVYFSSYSVNQSETLVENDQEVKSGFTGLNDLNYIDEQYLVTNATETQKGEIMSNRGNISVNSHDVSDLNFIDKQILRSSYESNNLDENNFASESIDPDKSRIVEELNDLDFAYSFEDSITEDSNNGMIRRPKSQNKTYDAIDEVTRREALEEHLLSLIEEGSDFRQKLSVIKENRNMNVKEKKFGTTSTDLPASTDPPASSDKAAAFNTSGENLSRNIEHLSTRSAYDYIKEKRREAVLCSKKEIKGEILPHERYKKIILAVPTYSQHTQYDMAKELQKNILYNKDDIVAIFKPYGIAAHGGGGGDESVHNRLNIVNLMPLLSKLMKEEALIPVHRLDLNTTGVMLLAKTPEMADKLKKMFKEHRIKKTYLAITKGIPSPMNGVIDIPIGEGKVDRFERMVLRPDIPGFRGRSGQSKKAITRYKVLSTANCCSLLEVNPITGVKHQVRVHLGFGINCPVLGDPKYSFLTKIAPQKLPSEALDKLGLKQSRVRSLPLHLHSFSINIPIYDENNRDIFIRVPPPKFFRTTLQALKLSSRLNRLSNDYSELIYGYE